MKKAWKIFKKFLFWIFFIGLFLVTVSTVILHIYEDDIKQYAITELNNYLNTDVEVRNMDVSIFHDFPNASIEFENVFIADAFKNIESDDTLLFANKLYFHFNIFDIWSGDYKVKRASINTGQINLKTAIDGDVNYDILVENEDTTTTDGKFSFLLELLKVENIDFGLKNQSTNQNYQVKIKSALISGNFAATDYQLKAEGDLFINKIKSSSLTLIADKEAKLDLALDIDSKRKSYLFKKGDLALEEMQFNITGGIDSTSINLDVIGRKIQVSQVVSSIIPENSEASDKYIGEGIVDFSGKIIGPLSRTEMPSIEASFAVENGALVQSKNKLKINNITLIGNYKNAFEDRLEELNFKTFGFALLNSRLDGSGRIENFAQPKFTTKIKGNLDLAAFNQFFDFKNIAQLGGNLTMDLTSVIRFFDPEYRKDKFEILASSGTLSLKNITYKAVDSDLHYTNISGEIIINGKDAAANNLSIKTQKSDLLLNGAMKNFVSYIDGSGSLGMIASLEAKNIDLNEFLGPSNKEKNGPLTMFQLPGNLNLNIQMNLKNLLWDNHKFEDIAGQLLFTNRKVTINQIRLKTLGGNVTGKLVLNNMLERGNVVDGNMSFSSINVKELFAEWDNFQQKSITDQHLSGTVDGSVNILLLFNPYFSLIEEQIFSVSNIRIVNGELNNLETMKAITEYMRSNKALKLMLNKHIDKFEEKLMHLKFSEMKNKIEIKNRRLTIPKMTIKSNALDVDLFGWHDFDNNIEYHFSFRFNQLKTKAEYTEFGKIEDDGLGITIYMTMAGTIDEPTFSLDSDERKNDIKESIDLEKSTVKSMLKTEFGLFQKDTTIKQLDAENKNEVEFIFYETDVQIETIDTTAKKTKNNKRVGKFIDKLKQEAEKDKEEIDYPTDL